MTIFDAPSRESCVARRERTNTPLQALVLMNEQQYFGAAIHLADTLLVQSDLSDDQRISVAWETVTSREPDEFSQATLASALQQFRDVYSRDKAAAKEMLTVNNASPVVSGSETVSFVERAALAMVIHSILNLDVTRNRE